MSGQPPDGMLLRSLWCMAGRGPSETMAVKLDGRTGENATRLFAMHLNRGGQHRAALPILCALG